MVSVVDPSAYIREEYTAFRIHTRDGETLIGIITERAANQITLVDSSQQKTVIPKAQILEERAMPTSLMPEGLLAGLSDQQAATCSSTFVGEAAGGLNSRGSGILPLEFTAAGSRSHR